MTTTNTWMQALRTAVRGEVYDDAALRGMYATDASHYQVMPRAVVVPLDEHDVQQVVRIARENQIPLTGRGAGTSLAGQTFGPGIVLDFSKHMNQVLEVHAEERWARVQPGIVRDHLNTQLAEHGLQFAPDPATTSRATIGGMINNNSSGMRSVKYGMTIDHVLALRVLLSDGSVVALGEDQAMPPPRGGDTHASPDRLSALDQSIERLVSTHREEIRRRYPKVMRRVSGYALDAMLDEQQRNLAHLIVGSEGTLGIVTEAKIKLVPTPGATALCIVHFDGLVESLRHVPAMLEHGPSAIELLDEIIVQESRTNASTRGYAGFYEGTPNCVQIVEFMAETSGEASRLCHAFAEDMQRRGVGTAHVIRDDPAQIAEVWELRRLGVGLQSNIGGSTKPLDFIDDACVPTEHMAAYVEKLQAICDKHNVRMPICCHASVGVLHPKPMLDLHKPEGRETMRAIADEAFELVLSYGGSWSGEHGDGLVRGQYIKRFFGEALYDAFVEVKRLFDPMGLMNPGKIIDTPGMTEHLRHGQKDYELRLAEVSSGFRYEEQGGFGKAVEQCNGVGACRKVGKGTMCPSYMATRDEQDSTRGRANVLRLAMTGQLDEDGLAGDGVKDALELCLSCKACKTECPNAVDMSKMKADALQARYLRHGTPLSARLIGHLRWAATLLGGSLLAWPTNALLRIGWVRGLVERFMGIDRRRPLPRFAISSLMSNIDVQCSEVQDPDDDRPKVVLFADTYANYFEPCVGLAALRLLEDCGYAVQTASPGCCQRPAISKGLVNLAKHDGAKTMKRLGVHAEQGTPILFIEPSCASAIADDLPDLIEDRNLGQRVKDHCFLIEDFLAGESEAGRLSGRFVAEHGEVLLHGHCHQKALFGTQGLRKLLGSVEELSHNEVDSGCCGMAGSFGYEHHDLSMQIGEQRLFPAVREAASRGAAVCANGFSCRHQIADGCGVNAKHWVELVRFEPQETKA